jgi:hypothetical protein
MDAGYISIALSSITLIVLVIEKVFGGGNALAAKFAKLDKSTDERITALRLELSTKVDEYEDNYAVGLDTIKANIHAMQIGLLEFRAKMAEEYMRKPDYALGIADIRREVHEGFEKMEKRLERMETNMIHKEQR